MIEDLFLFGDKVFVGMFLFLFLFMGFIVIIWILFELNFVFVIKFLVWGYFVKCYLYFIEFFECKKILIILFFIIIVI